MKRMGPPEEERGRGMARTPANRRGQAGGVKRQVLLSAIFKPAVQVVESEAEAESEEQGPEAEEQTPTSPGGTRTTRSSGVVVATSAENWTKYDRKDYIRWGERGGRPELVHKLTRAELNQRARARERGEQHYTSKRFEPNAAQRLEIVKVLEEERKKYTDDQEYWSLMAARFAGSRNVKDKDTRKRIKAQLKSYQARKEADLKFVEEEQLGVAGGKRQGDATPAYKIKKAGKFARRMEQQGAKRTGPPNPFEQILLDLGAWVKREERHGHDLDHEDLVDEYEELISKELLFLLAKEKEKGSLEAEEATAKQAFTERLQKLMDFHYSYNMRQRIANQLQVKLLLPTRVSTLSSEEEKLRSHLTWQMFDQKLHLAAFGPAAELHKEVFGAESWQDHLDEIVLEFEDEIPFWIAVARTRKVVSKETYQKLRNVQCDKKHRQRRRQAEKQKVKNLKLKGSKAKPGDTDIVKGALTSNAERMRLTIVDRSVVEHYFAKDGRRPVGRRLKMIVVFPGVWANMANMTVKKPYDLIDEERLLIEGEEQVRPANSGSKGRMKKLCEMREQEPEMWKHAETMQSPSANRDEVKRDQLINELARGVVIKQLHLPQ